VDCLDETSVALFLDRKLSPERAAGLEAHIDTCSTCRHVLAALARGRAVASSRSGTEEPSGPVEQSPTDLIDRYVLLREIGSGGMGTVYAAYDPVLDRKVALKLLRRSGSADSQARLVREARALARVSSPNVVAVHDAGTFDDQVYIAMELVTGGTLTGWLRERPRGWPEVVRVFEAAGRGLAAAHACGLVHRDFKPDNVLLDGDRVRVADFGLAAPLEPAAASSPGLATPPDRSLTLTGTIVGTPAYMAPEQHAGEQIDARSDQFSFCVALYEALFGHRPFAGDTVEQLAAEVRAGRVRTAAGTVPAWLRGLVTRGLSSEPGRRFASMDALLDELVGYRLRRRRWRVAAAAIAIAGAGATGAVVLSEPPADRCEGADARPSISYDPTAIRAAFAVIKPDTTATVDHVLATIETWRERAGALRARACRASRIEGTESSELLDLRVECVARSAERVEALARVLAAPTPKLVDDAVMAIEHAADLEPCSSPRALLEPLREPTNPALRGRAEVMRKQLATASAATAAGRYQEARDTVRVVASAAAAAQLHAIEAEAWHAIGKAEEGAQSFLASREALQRALIASEAAGHDRLRALLYLELANAENRLDRRADARRWVAQARALAEHLELAAIKADITYQEGLLAVWEDDYATAVTKLRAAQLEHERTAGDDLGTMQRLQALGVALWQHNDTAEAERVSRRALAIGERLLGKRHPSLIHILTNLGSIALVLGRPNDAIQDLERAFAIAEANPGPDGTLLAKASGLLGVLLAQTGKNEEAIGYLDRAIAASRPSVGDDSGQFATMLNLRGQFLADLGRFDAALADQERAVEIVRERLGADSLDLAISLEGVGRTLQGLRRYGDSIRAYDEALQIRTRSPAGERSQLFYCEQGLGVSLREGGRAAEAVAHLERAIALRSDGAEYDPSELADARIDLARALLTLGRERARAIELLQAARTTYRAIEGGSAKVTAITAVLAERGVK